MTFFSIGMFTGGLAIVLGAVEPATDVSQTSVVIVLGGAITAAAAVAQKWLEDRRNAREIDLARHKVEIRTDEHWRVNIAQQRWIVMQHRWDCRLRDALLKRPDAPEIDMPPPAPGLPDGYLRSLDGDHDA